LVATNSAKTMLKLHRGQKYVAESLQVAFGVEKIHVCLHVEWARKKLGATTP
jgi:hypothetical protein